MKRLALILGLSLLLLPAAAVAQSIDFSFVGGTWSFNSSTGILTINNTGQNGGAYVTTTYGTGVYGVTGSGLSISTGPGTLPGTFPAGGSVDVTQDTSAVCAADCLTGSFTSIQTVATGGSDAYSFTADFIGGTLDQNLLNLLVAEDLLPAGSLNVVTGLVTGNLLDASCSDGSCSGTLGSLDVSVTPVPEPGTLTLLGTGLLGLAGAVRRRLKKSKV